jgi:hypothetical protein
MRARHLVATAAAVATVLGTLGLGQAASAAAPTTAAADAAFILDAQLPDGAIAWYTDRRHIDPYLANYAAIGLAAVADTQHDATGTADRKAALRWLRWYAAHQDQSGFVTDYDVTADGTETSTGDEDSTDAYAGTFLLAVHAVAVSGAARSSLQPLATAVSKAITAIEATQDSDGLTWAKPTWHVKYLMDQTEAYAGLEAAVATGSLIGLPKAERQRAAADAARMAAGMATLWDAPTGAYDWARHDNGAQQPTNWANLYSDSMEQAWIASLGPVSKAQASTLMGTVSADHPQWAQPLAVDQVNGDPASVGYWPLAGWAYLRTGNTTAAAAAAASIRAAATSQADAWPYTPGVAGQLVLLETGDLRLVE